MTITRDTLHSFLDYNLTTSAGSWLQSLVVVEHLGRVGEALHLPLDVCLHIGDGDGGFLLEYGTAERGGECKNEANKENLNRGVGFGVLF